MKKVLKTLLYVFLIVILLFIIFLTISIVSDYKPDEITIISKTNNSDELSDSLYFSVLSWNLGYCGLSDDMDFFYDGGKQVRTSKQNVLNNIAKIKSFLKSNDSISFMLLQEVDKRSKRSYRMNEVDSLKTELSNFKSFFGKNYDVFYVPYPLTSPYGCAVSGLLSFSKPQPSKVARYSFPSSYGFPLKYFMLDRCFVVMRLRVANGKELLIINTHNSAYDDGSMRMEEMAFLKKFLISEYEKGNYVIVGGDWNQCPPNLKHNIPKCIFDEDDFLQIQEDYMPADWTWVFSNNVPTNRRVYEVWNKETTKTTIIDYFLISPNIQKISFKTINLNFENSDHNPIIGHFKLSN